MTYTKDNPKLVEDCFDFKNKQTFTGVVKEKCGDIAYYLNGEYHREDGPAIEYANGTKEWFLNGKQNRTNGPAVEFADGGKKWYLNDKYHREDGPAVELASGYKAWYLNGKYYGCNDYYTNESWIRFVKLRLLK